MRRALVLFALLAACGGAQKSAVRHDHEPASLRKRTGDPPRVANVFTVRLWADANHRRELTNWRLRFERSLTRANRFLQERLGVTLEVVEASDWERPEPVGDDLEETLSELRTMDPGEGVDFVVGLVSALPIYTPDVHAIGMAQMFGKHFVLRGMNDIKDFDHLMQYRDNEEAPDVYDERVNHRETAALLHEIGHTLGAVHFNARDTFMFPSWTKEQDKFDPKNLELMELTTRHRLRAQKSLKLDAEALGELRELIMQPGWEDHDPRELADLRMMIDGGILSDGPRRKGWDEAIADLHADNPEGAWKKLQPIYDSTPDDPIVITLACAIFAQRKVEKERGAKLCRQAADLLPERTGPLLDLVQLLLGEKQFSAAEKVLGEVRARCEKTPCPRNERTYAAQLHANTGLVTYAIELARTSTRTTQAVLKWATHASKRCGLSKEIPPDREGELVRFCDDISAATNARDLPRAKALLKTAKQKLPRAPALLLLECRVAVAAFERTRAERSCGEVVRSPIEPAEAHLLLAILSRIAGRPQGIIKHAERARVLDPELQPAWALLAEVYTKRGESAALENLDAEHRATFGRPLAR